MGTMNATDIAITTEQVALAHAIAARARCDVRTALKAIRYGAEVIRTRTTREDVASAMRELGAAR